MKEMSEELKEEIRLAEGEFELNEYEDQILKRMKIIIGLKLKIQQVTMVGFTQGLTSSLHLKQRIGMVW